MSAASGRPGTAGRNVQGAGAVSHSEPADAKEIRFEDSSIQTSALHRFHRRGADAAPYDAGAK